MALDDDYTPVCGVCGMVGVRTPGRTTPRWTHPPTVHDFTTRMAHAFVSDEEFVKADEHRKELRSRRIRFSPAEESFLRQTEAW